MTYRIAEAIIYATKYCFFLVIISKTPTTIDTIQNRIKSKLDNFITWIYRCGETACPEDWKPQVRA